GNHRRSNTASRRSSAFSSNVAGIWRQRDLLSSRTNDDDDATLVDVRTSTSDDASSDDFRRALVVGATLPRVSCSRRYFQNFSVAGFVPSSAAKASALRSFSRHRSIRFRHSSRPVRVLRSSINRSLRDQPAYVCDARDRTDTIAVYAFGEPVDMRKSFNTLSALVVTLGREVLSGHFFLFVSRDRKRAKVLFFDGT